MPLNVAMQNAHTRVLNRGVWPASACAYAYASRARDLVSGRSNLEREYRDCIKSRRQDWDHKAYRDAPSAI